MSRIAKITTIVLVCGITLSAAAYFLRDTAVAGVVMQKVNTYRLNQGLVGWWTFDGTDVNWTTGRVSDKSGNNKYGTIIGMATATAPIAGKIGQALQFDGVDDNVDVSNFSTVTASPFTWSFWYNGKGGSAEDIISLGFYRYCGSNVGGNFRCTVDGDAYNGVSASDSLVSDGNWHLISYVYTNDSLSELYVDGVQTDSGANTAATAGVSSVSFGYNPGGAFGAAALDDVRIYNRALSPSEVKLLYTSTAGSKMNTSKNVIPGSTLQTGLVGLWSFNGPDLTDKVYDRSGQGNNGYFIGGATNTAKVSGKVGQALTFGYNTTKFVDVKPASSINDLVTKTLCAWIYPRSFGLSANDASIISKWWSASNGAWAFFLGDDNGGTQALYYVQDFTPNDGNWRSPASSITLNTWQHVCVSYDRSSTSNDPIFYVNGTPQATTEYATPTGSSNGDSFYDMTLGNWDSTSQSSLDGSLDDVRIYNRALSPSEVKDLYTATMGTKVNHSQNTVPGSTLQQGLVGLWSFNGPDLTDKVYDRSGQGNNGYFVGNATNSAKTSGKIGQGLRFDGVNDYVDTVDINATDGASYLTISAWIKEDSLVADRGIVAKWSGGSNHWVLYTESSPGPDVMAFNSGNGGVARTASGTHEAGIWEHWVVVFDGTQSGDANRLKMFKNGIQLSLSFSSTVPATLASNTNTVKIGASGDVASPCCFWNGKIDETRIYNRALSAAEVKLLYNLGH